MNTKLIYQVTPSPFPPPQGCKSAIFSAEGSPPDIRRAGIKVGVAFSCILLFLGMATGMFLLLSVHGVEEEKSSGSACIFCHTEYQGRKEAYLHKPFYEKKCQACHTEFHGDNPRPEEARRGDLELEIEVCYTCHEEDGLGESHPVGANMLDVKRGTSMTCISCHEPHWSDFKYILKQEEKAELCLGCHPELR